MDVAIATGIKYTTFCFERNHDTLMVPYILRDASIIIILKCMERVCLKMYLNKLFCFGFR